MIQILKFHFFNQITFFLFFSDSHAHKRLRNIRLGKNERLFIEAFCSLFDAITNTVDKITDVLDD